ncbi:MAG TPA: sugar ABC transporter permease [Candidatus Limnocylindria bacterium]|nr:sugar ABC transporter permease [Candidatus Limnocylindria bacterium]
MQVNEQGGALLTSGPPGSRGFFPSIGRALAGAWAGARRFFLEFAHALRDGDAWVRLSLLVWGAGYFARRQYARGALVTLLQAFLFIFYPTVLWPYLTRFDTLGTVKRASVYNPATGRNEVNDYDHSFQILLFGLIAILVLLVTLVLWMRNVVAVRRVHADWQAGRHVNTFRDDLHDHLNRKFHTTLLSLPVLGITLFTVVPLLVMILIAFTNYDRQHMVPTNLFTWVGLANFRALFTSTTTATFGYSFARVLGWTLLWAFAATFTNYILGILLAMFINNRKTRLKRLWRTFFMVSIAVPQFVSLLLVRNFFANTGIVNTLAANIGLTGLLKQLGILPVTAAYIPFLTDPTWAKVMIILINVWIGIPYLMLIATGILMNIPQDLLESARIDGANAWHSFRSITMPYILFVTGPYLVTSIVHNINNFNVIYLLTNDVYVTKDQLLANSNAQEIDLLVTWLYRLTQNYNNFKMASVLGILIFLISAVFTVTAFRIMLRGDREERFQ